MSVDVRAEPDAPEPESSARLLVAPADGTPDGRRPPTPAIEATIAALRRRHRTDRGRRRARARLPLHPACLPDPAAPSRRGHPPDRPDRLRRHTRSRRARRRASPTPSGSSTPPARTCRACSRSGMTPTRLFDTELAARLLNYPRVALGTMLEELLGVRLLKEHSAADWSTRPLPAEWLTYAALDVELLVELRDVLAAQLVAAGKQEWAAEEFAALAAGAGTLGRAAGRPLAADVGHPPGTQPPRTGVRGRALAHPRRDRPGQRTGHRRRSCRTSRSPSWPPRTIPIGPPRTGSPASSGGRRVGTCRSGWRGCSGCPPSGTPSCHRCTSRAPVPRSLACGRRRTRSPPPG